MKVVSCGVYFGVLHKAAKKCGLHPDCTSSDDIEGKKMIVKVPNVRNID